MRNNDLAICDLGRDLAEPSGDVLVRETMKSVTAYPLEIKLLRDRIVIGQVRVASVECSIEAGDLQEMRLPLQYRANRSKIIRLVERSERGKSLKPVEHCSR